jgi:hypothetical protein
MLIQMDTMRLHLIICHRTGVDIGIYLAEQGLAADLNTPSQIAQRSEATEASLHQNEDNLASQGSTFSSLSTGQMRVLFR